MLHFYTPSRQQRDNRGALQVASDDFERLWSYGMDNVSPSPNPRGGPPIRRRQATFGPQTSMGIMTPEGLAGRGARRSVSASHTRAAQPRAGEAASKAVFLM